ncbi:MAG: right-handed parallel beta-helix repeat-containing protein [Pseudomonadota bacterium]
MNTPNPLLTKTICRTNCAYAVLFVTLCCLAIMLTPGSSNAAETNYIKKTNYKFPTASVFVAVDGNNNHSGTIGNPVRTVTRAVEIAKPGDTIVIRAGTYRESIGGISKRLNLQPYPNEEVWLKGSHVVSDWTKTESGWRSEKWRSNFCRDCFDANNLDPGNLAAGLPEQVFVNGLPLKQVQFVHQLDLNSFFVDNGNNTITIGKNPSGKRIEVSSYNAALIVWSGAEGSKIRGLGFAHYSPVAQPGLGSTVKIDAAKIVFENNTITTSAVKGLEVFAHDVKVVGNRFVRNGMMGLAAWKADRLVVTGNQFIENNTEKFAVTGPVSEAAGAKITVSRHLFITDNEFVGNLANGLWLDINVHDANILRNKLEDNERHGIFYELSSHGRIISNLVINSGLGGITIADSNQIDIYNNTLVDNRIGLVIQDDWRENDDPSEIEIGNTWVSSSISFANNFIGTFVKTPNEALIWIRDFEDKRSPNEMLTVLENNQFHRATLTKRPPLVEWWFNGKPTYFDSSEEFQNSTGFNANGFSTYGIEPDTLFLDWQNGRFELKKSSPGWGKATNFPPTTQKRTGIGIIKPPGIGIFGLR